MELAFWISIGIIAYAYFGYPLSLYILAKRSKIKLHRDSSYHPQITVIVAGHNEAKGIKNKLLDLFKQTYLPLMEIVVASDASTDATDDIVMDLIENNPSVRIKLVRIAQRGGKDAALKAAIEATTSKIIVVTDVSSTLRKDAIARIVENFANPIVGAVDGLSVITNEKNGGGEGIYIKYENKIREWESKVGSLITLGGTFLAVRREVYIDFPSDIQCDFRSALKSKELGYWAILDTSAVAEYKEVADKSKEYIRKLRTIVRGLNTFSHFTHLLNPFKYGWFSYQLFCHKLLKWLVPFFMIVAFISNVLLMFEFGEPQIGVFNGPAVFYGVMFMCQLFFYIAALSEKSWTKIPRFFVMSNFAIVHAWISYIRGERFVMWSPSKR